jgi:hypothetical protein
VAKERSFLTRVLLPSRVDVRDGKDGPVLFGFRSNFNILGRLLSRRGEERIDIYDGQEELIGYLDIKKQGWILESFSFAIYDEQDQEVASIMLPKQYHLLAPDAKTTLGRMYDESHAAQVERSMKAGKRVIVTGGLKLGEAPLRLDLDPDLVKDVKLKVLLLGTVLAMECRGLGTAYLKKD